MLLNISLSNYRSLHSTYNSRLLASRLFCRPPPPPPTPLCQVFLLYNQCSGSERILYGSGILYQFPNFTDPDPTCVPAIVNKKNFVKTILLLKSSHKCKYIYTSDQKDKICRRNTSYYKFCNNNLRNRKDPDPYKIMMDSDQGMPEVTDRVDPGPEHCL